MTLTERLRLAVLELDARGLDPAAIAKSIGGGVTADRVEEILDGDLYAPVVVIPTFAEPETESPAMAVTLDWSEPPASAGRGSGRSKEIDEIVAALKSRPGSWAAVAKQQHTASGHTVWAKRGCEAVSRVEAQEGDDGKRWTIYARWPK